MKIFAIVENNKIINTVICESLELMQALVPEHTIIEESDTTGFSWIGAEVIGGRFKPPQPYESWSFNPELFAWIAPTPQPDFPSYWDEDTLSWIEITLPTEPIEE